MTKRCPKCKKTEEETEFYKNTWWCKKCKQKQSQKIYAPTKAKVRAKRLAQYRDGKKWCKYCRRWLDPSRFNKHRDHWDGLTHKCKDCISEYTKRKYYENREKNLEDGRRWYQKNKKRKRNTDRKWRQENPEKSRAIWHRYKSRKLAAEGDFTSEQWEAVKEYYCPDGKCLSCTNKRSLTIDHVIPLIKGGSNFITNIQPICQPCNSTKGDERIIDYRPDKGLFTKELMNES